MFHFQNSLKHQGKEQHIKVVWTFPSTNYTADTNHRTMTSNRLHRSHSSKVIKVILQHKFPAIQFMTKKMDMIVQQATQILIPKLLIKNSSFLNHSTVRPQFQILICSQCIRRSGPKKQGRGDCRKGELGIQGGHWLWKERVEKGDYMNNGNGQRREESEWMIAIKCT